MMQFSAIKFELEIMITHQVQGSHFCQTCFILCCNCVFPLHALFTVSQTLLRVPLDHRQTFPVKSPSQSKDFFSDCFGYGLILSHLNFLTCEDHLRSIFMYHFNGDLKYVSWYTFTRLFTQIIYVFTYLHYTLKCRLL